MQQFPVQTVNAISSPAVVAIDQGIDAHFQAINDVAGSKFVWRDKLLLSLIHI